MVATRARDGKGLDILLDTVETVISEDLQHKKPSFSSPEELACEAGRIYSLSVKESERGSYSPRERLADRILTSKLLGFPIMLLLLLGIFWLTIEGANYPSSLLSGFLLGLEDDIFRFLSFLHLPTMICEALVFGVYRTLSWVVSVMLPLPALVLILICIDVWSPRGSSE